MENTYNMCQWTNCIMFAIKHGKYCKEHSILNNQIRRKENTKKYHKSEYFQLYIKKYRKYSKQHKLYQRKYHNEIYKDKFRLYLKNYKSERRKNDINFKIIENMRNRLHHVISRNGKRGKTLEYIDCSSHQLKEHLKKQFSIGMTLDNYGVGKGKWSIDHIIPCSAFDLSKEEEISKCFHYTNLQPLWFDENVRKSDKISS